MAGGVFEYTNVPKRLPDLLGKIRTIGIPEKATLDWLKSIGFSSSNDRSMLRVIKFVGFCNGAGNPAELWREYRGGQHRRALGNAIVKAYRDLFSVYPDAYRRSTEEIQDFFGSRSDVNRGTIGLAVNTFQVLCSLAEFDESVDQAPPSGTATDVDGKPVLTPVMPRFQGLTLNVNVQVTLPETTNEEVYEKLFAAMERHLFRSPESHA